MLLDPASLLVNRKAKQRKTDRIDATKMVRALLAYDRGGAAVLSRVRVPSVADEDRKRLLRERQRLVKERTSLTNTIKGLLKLHCIFDLEPRAPEFDVKFAAVRTANGEPFPSQARQEIERIAERLAVVLRQVEAVEAERDAFVSSGRSPRPAVARAGSDAGAAAKIATLARLKGIGVNDATLLTHEILYRDFDNRRELASWAGLTSTHWASGELQYDQGIGRDGPASCAVKTPLTHILTRNGIPLQILSMTDTLYRGVAACADWRAQPTSEEFCGDVRRLHSAVRGATPLQG